MVFTDRQAAGRQLADQLGHYRGKNPVILAIPRGGVVVGAAILSRLGGTLDLTIPRKIGLPENPEVAVAALAENGSLVTDPEMTRRFAVPPEYLARAAAEQQAEIHRRRALYCGDRPPTELRGQIVILVDDGIATGFTTKAALRSIRNQRPKTLVLAVPVAPTEVIGELESLVDEVVCLATPEPFYAVGQFYRDFTQVTDAEVIDLLRSC